MSVVINKSLMLLLYT
uniref:Uncharacterized protein n=1 Tax=Rhizophora mucronata TaxID=61149 RepID=A0A2P2R1A8_RHIMU